MQENAAPVKKDERRLNKDEQIPPNRMQPLKRNARSQRNIEAREDALLAAHIKANQALQKRLEENAKEDVPALGARSCLLFERAQPFLSDTVVPLLANC